MSIPLTELLKNNQYKSHVAKMLKSDSSFDILNVDDDQPELSFAQAIYGQLEDSEVPPFYLSLRIHQNILHNTMLDSRASHNFMKKAIMEKLGLDITHPYHELYSFDSGRVHCLGIIKDLVVSLDKIPTNNVLMDVVVFDIPPWFGMLLSRSWGAKLRGTLQLDFSYATIRIFEQLIKLYQEMKMKYMITSKERPNNHPIHVVHTYLESFILFNDNGLNYDDIHLVEVEDVPEIHNCIRAIIKKEK